MGDCIQNFRDEVTKRLTCDNSAKKRLLESFDKNMVTPLLEGCAEPTVETLQASLGTPQSVAEVLMEQLTEEEVQHYSKQKKMRKAIFWGVLAAIVVIVLLFAVYVCFFKEMSNIDIIDSGVIEIPDNPLK